MEDRNRMISNIVAYAESGTVPELSGFELIVFNNIRMSIDKAMKNYDLSIEKDTKRRGKRKARSLQCKGCNKSTDCNNKEQFKQTGKCKEAEVDDQAKAKLDQCAGCSSFMSCKQKSKFVKNKEQQEPCPKFSKSSNIYYNYSYNDSIDNTIFSSTNVSEKNSISIPSSTSKEKRKVSNFSGGGDGGGSSSVYEKEKVIDHLESRGVNREWASTNYDDLEAIGFKTGRNPITNLISFMTSKWEKFMSAQEKKKTEAEMKEKQSRAEQDAKDRELGRGAYAVPAETRALFSRVKKRIVDEGHDDNGFMQAFDLVSVSDTEIVLSAESSVTFEVYEKSSKTELYQYLLEELPGRKIVKKTRS